MKRNQSGFTLIEIAIVLVIIGLLLGGVLKGQELINSARVKNLATDFRNIPVFIYGYQDKYRALPGDDIQAATHLTGVSGVTATNGDGNGVIDGAWNATSGESFEFWQQVRLAGMLPGTTTKTDSAYVATNSVGGKLGVTNSGTNTPITGMRGTYVVCSGSIAGKFAKQLDTSMDDGNTAGGSMMAVASGTSATATTDIGEDTTYTVCMGF
jgi:prepilin-type N-terminal cleavage/methylation domain-containing protein